MDWSKAKTILIIALLLTNIFLIFTYGNLDKKENPGSIDEATLISLLADRGVELDMAIPNKARAMQLLSVEVVHVPKEDVSALLGSEGSGELFDIETIVGGHRAGDIGDPEVIKAYADRSKNFITALGLMTDSVVFDKINTQNTGNTDVAIRFKTMAGNFRVEESYMECIFRDGRLVDFNSKWLIPASYSRKKVQVMDPAVALLSLVSDGDVEKAQGGTVKVDNMELIYWLDDRSADIDQAVKDTAFPTWKITYNGDSVKYFNAAQL